MMRDLKRHLAGITGTSCSHGHEAWDEEIRYEACAKHHVDAAYDCVRQFLKQPEVQAALKEVARNEDFTSDDVVAEVIKIILGEDNGAA